MALKSINANANYRLTIYGILGFQLLPAEPVYPVIVTLSLPDTVYVKFPHCSARADDDRNMKLIKDKNEYWFSEVRSSAPLETVKIHLITAINH